MIPNAETENLIRRYLLGELRDADLFAAEIRLLDDADFAAQVQLLEAELPEAYLDNALSAQERAQFETHFLAAPPHRRQLAVARALRRYAEQASHPVQVSEAQASNMTAATELPQATPPFPSDTSGWAALFRPAGWRLGWQLAFAAVVLIIGLGVWRLLRAPSTVEHGLQALEEAFHQQRLVEARITGFGYAPYLPPVLLKGPAAETGKIDNNALDRAKQLLLAGAADRRDPRYLHALGKFYLAQKEFEKALEQLRAGRALAPRSATLQADLGAALLGKIERDSLTETGRRKEDFEECLAALNQALQLEPHLLEALFNRALLKQREQLRREARADWEQYLQLDQTSPWAAEARQNLKQIEAALRNAVLREEQLYQDFRAARARRDAEKMFDAFRLSYSFNGNYVTEKLLDAYLAARLGRQTDAAAEHLQTLVELGGLAQKRLGDCYLSDLAQFYVQARPEQLAQAARARQLMAEAYGFYGKAENDHAVELYEQARDSFTQAGDVAEALFALAWIGHCHHQRSDTTQNLRAFQALLPACAASKYRWMEANAWCGLANGHNSAGQFSQAIADCVRCGEIAQALGDQTGLLRSRYMLANFYEELGKHDENLRLCAQGRKQAAAVAAGIRYELPFYNLSARSLSAFGLHEAALAYQREALHMAEETKSPRLAAYGYINQGRIYARRQDFVAAIASAQRGIAIGRDLPDDGTGQDFVHTGLLHLGHIYRAAGQFAEALAAFVQVKDYYRQSKKQVYFYGAAKGRLLTLIAQGQDAAARIELEQVLALYETYRQSIQEESNRNSFFDKEQGIYAIAVDFALTRLKDYEQALDYAELARARSLLDEVRRGAAVVNGPNVPELQIKAGATPRSARELQRQLPRDVQLLEYAVLADKLALWVITANGIKCAEVAIPEGQLRARIEAYLALINTAPGKGDERWRAPAAELYELLIRPVEGLLDRQKPLYIVPDKLLAKLPFGTLAPAASRVLLEDYALGYAASANMFLDATVAARQKTDGTPERLLAVGNPRFDHQAFPGLDDLPPAEKEALASSLFYQAPVLFVREQATKGAVLRELARADVAHLATHYVTDQWSPLLSRVPLAASPGHDGALSMRELYQLPALPLRLVVLSACQTYGEEYFAGEGAIGAARAFEAAGVPLVVASLWPVDAQASQDLLVNFHRLRKQAGQASGAALRNAQLEMLHNSGVYQHPYFWAAFAAVGGYTRY